MDDVASIQVWWCWCAQARVKSSAVTADWPYQPWTKTVTAPLLPVVKVTLSWFQAELFDQVLAEAPPVTPM